jgi:hypothetical protein
MGATSTIGMIPTLTLSTSVAPVPASPSEDPQPAPAPTRASTVIPVMNRRMGNLP